MKIVAQREVTRVERFPGRGILREGQSVMCGSKTEGYSGGDGVSKGFFQQRCYL